MTAGLFAQYLAVALAVLASIAVVMLKQFPNATRRLRVALALPLLREGSPGWLKPLGRAIAPPPRKTGDGCDGCSSCDPD